MDVLKKLDHEGTGGMDRLNEILVALQDEQDQLKKTLTFLAILTKRLEPYEIKPILVGGRALEFYTLGGYATKDIDLVIDGRERAQEIIEDMGFLRHLGDRHWYHEDLDLAVEIPDYFLAGSMEQIVTVHVNGMEAYIIGVEDLILDRLAAAKFWKSESDFEWAINLLDLHEKNINWKYLKKAAKKAEVKNVLVKAIRKYKTIKKIRDNDDV